jgi:hypothetical protein
MDLPLAAVVLVHLLINVGGAEVDFGAANGLAGVRVKNIGLAHVHLLMAYGAARPAKNDWNELHYVG